MDKVTMNVEVVDLTKAPVMPEIVYVEAVFMPNGELVSQLGNKFVSSVDLDITRTVKLSSIDEVAE